MSALDEITARERIEHAGRPGDLLTMADGSQWFHAYTGAAPVRITGPAGLDDDSALAYLASLTASELATHRAWVLENVRDADKRAAMLARIDTTAGAEACRAGVRWYDNPHPSGSVAAYQWDAGHTRTRREGGARR